MASMRDVIYRSFRLLGVIASGESPDAAMTEDAITALNDMLDSWGLERLMVYSISPHTYSLVPNQQVYTLGPGGDFNQGRPNQIDQAYVLYQQTGALPATIPIQILNTDQWAALETKGVTSTFPTQMYSDGNSPLINLSFWPVPLLPQQIVLWTWDLLNDFDDSSISDDITFPPGYAKAIAYNLALELAPEYDVQPSAVVAAGALDAKSNIKRINTPDLLMSCDPSLTHTGRAGWDYRIGENR
jgi:hypothetical protein